MSTMQNGCAGFDTYLNPILGPILITPDVIIVQPLNLSMFVSSMLSVSDIPAHSAEQEVVYTMSHRGFTSTQLLVTKYHPCHSFQLFNAS